ncbi:hypothetical protein FD754_016177 [Muntiacus muntjak]|uniref:Transmembrane protein 273 n=1 Tax=Muntiacus muntjak TaxID=9888 RepID=A0A5N3VPP4_MUNMU|nr:hypothetical protein FD754_016177 [Muntiacus muntjak]
MELGKGCGSKAAGPGLDVGAAQVLATGKTAGAETDIKYAIIGTAVGIAISAGFLALKFCMIRKHMFDNDSSDLRSTNVGFNETIALKKRASRWDMLLTIFFEYGKSEASGDFLMEEMFSE